MKHGEIKGINNALDYCIQTLVKMRKDLLDAKNVNRQAVWAVSGLVIMLTTQVLKTSLTQVSMGFNSPNASAQKDLIAIKDSFNAFIDEMIGQS